MVWSKLGRNFSCVVRGMKIDSTPTLTHMKVHHVAEHVGPSSTDCPDIGWQLLVDVGNGHGLTMQPPPLHCQDKADWVDETTHVKH